MRFIDNLHTVRRVFVITLIWYHVFLECYHRNTSYQMKFITETCRTRWRLSQKHVVPDEGYYRNSSSKMRFITKTRRTRWRLLQKNVEPDEGHYRNRSYQKKVITETRRTRWRLLQKHVVPDEGYYRNMSYQMKVFTETRHTKPSSGTTCFCNNLHLVRRVSVITFLWYDMFL
jgi:hypothetical protein